MVTYREIKSTSLQSEKHDRNYRYSLLHASLYPGYDCVPYDGCLDFTDNVGVEAVP
jgi:hypothetical protein